MRQEQAAPGTNDMIYFFLFVAFAAGVGVGALGLWWLQCRDIFGGL